LLHSLGFTTAKRVKPYGSFLALVIILFVVAKVHFIQEGIKTQPYGSTLGNQIFLLSKTRFLVTKWTLAGNTGPQSH
jgi:hypothetical protein